jgi:hypothetical protein
MHGWPWLPVVAIGTIVIVAAVSALGRPRLVPALVVAFVVCDLGFFSAHGVHAAPVPLDNYWAALPAGGGRVVSTCWVDLGETLESRRPALDGLANMYLRNYADWAYLVKTGEPPAAGLITKINSQDGTFPARRDLLNAASVTTVVSCGGLNEPALTELDRVRDHFVYRNDTAWPRARWTCDLEEFSRADAVTRLVHARYSANGDLVASYPIAVRWAPGLSQTARTQLETRFALGVSESAEGSLRRYIVSNPDERILGALASEPAAEDTNGFDRATGRVPVPEPASGIAHGTDREWLIGTRPCTTQGTVTVVEQDRPDGLVIADADGPVAGYVYFSEPFYPERRAFVDGQAIEVRQTVLAFTAVPVPAGRHRVELRYVPSSLHVGAAISSLTLVGWLGVSWRTRSRHADRA